MSYDAISLRRLIVKLLLLAAAFASALIATGCGPSASDAGSADEVIENPFSKVIVIGIDGAEPVLMNSWMEEGILPNLSRLCRSGSYGPLKSVLPALSPVAWNSAATGVNPGKHGVFGFFESLAYGSEVPEDTFTSSNTRKAKAVWELLGQWGRSSGIINVPGTCPVEKINGFMISGFPYIPRSPLIYPPQTANRLLGYQFEMNIKIDPHNPLKTLHEWRKLTERQAEATLDLIDGKDWDLFWVVFSATDRISHHFWRYMDPEHPHYDPDAPSELKNAVPDTYVQIDQAVGKIMDTVDEIRQNEPVLVVLMSDHGFGPLYKGISVLHLIQLLWDAKSNSLPVFFRNRAFYVNLKEKYADGTVGSSRYFEERKRAIKILEGLEDPDNGRPLFQEIMCKEEVYEGDYADIGPDIICRVSDGYFLYDDPKADADRLAGTLPFRVFCGFHRLNGVIALQGKGIEAGTTIDGAEIIDVAPTVLCGLGLPIPEQMDGKPLMQAFLPDYRDRIPVKRAAIDMKRSIKSGRSGKDQNNVREQLKNLGYIQ